MKMYIRRLVMRLKIRWLEYRHRRKGTWSTTLPLFLEICRSVDTSLLGTYNVNLGNRVTFVCGFKNAHDVIKLLTEAVQSVNSRGYISDRVAGTQHQRREVKLDSFLVDDYKRSIRPMELFHETFALVESLTQALDKVEGDGTWRTYYQRKFEGLNKDLFAVLEALLKVALA